MRHVFCGFVALASLCHIPQASASFVNYTYTGVISYGSFATGTDTVVTTDLTGRKFTVVESFDTSKLLGAPTDGAKYSGQFGGTNYGASFAGAKAQIFIDGLPSKSIADWKDSTQNDTRVGTPSSVTSVAGYESFIDSSNLLHFYDDSLQLSAFSPLITFDYTKPFSLTTSTAAFSGTYAVNEYVKDFGGTYYAFSYANANLQPMTLTVTNTLTAVPLPGALPLFGAALLALGGAGLVAHRRHGRPQASL